MKLATKIACRSLGTAGMLLACVDSMKVAKQFSEIGSDHRQEHYLEKVYYKTRTLDKVNYADNALREKAFDIRSKNPIPSIWGKFEGGFKGFMYGMANYLPIVASSALAILGKNIVAKAGAIGLGCIAVYKVLRNCCGVGKNNPMN